MSAVVDPEAGTVTARIRRMLREAGREVQGEEQKNGDWIIYARQGGFVITITWPSGRRFMTVVFHGEIGDKAILRRLGELFSDPGKGGNLHYALVTALTYPGTFYSLLRNGDSLAGFDVGALIFPFEEGFSVVELHHAIQNVVNAALLGWAFIGSVLGVSDLEERVKDRLAQTSPDGMYA